MDDNTAATFLFVAAHEERKVAKALASGADAVILDLEDAVPLAVKDEAREAAARVVNSGRGDEAPQLWVRVNGADTPHFAADVDRLEWRRVDGVVLAKAEDPSAVGVLSEVGVPRQLLLVETVAGLDRLDTLLAAARPGARLALGTWDLARDLDLPGIDDPDDSELIWHVRCEMVLESRRRKLDAPVDGVFGRLGDLPGLEAVCQRVRRIGFGGKLLIHPEQVPVASRVFNADESRLHEAQEIITAYEAAVREGQGAVRHRGMLIDQVHVERARRLIERWQERADHRRVRG